ncbi:MAG: electron transfer flavoprotein subunit alpha/FixB family protein [bacterium]|nr:electron transfer flavoprotein subunit alpha/FixB family protein [bacterium]
MSLVVLALKKRNNETENVALELVSKAKKFYNGEISAILLAAENSDESKNIEKLSQAGVNKIYVIKNTKLDRYSTLYYKEAVLRSLEKINPDIFLIGATVNGRDLAPRIASALGAGLTADCTDLGLTEEGKLAATRPTFGGSLMATILSRTTPQMATVRPKVFKMNEPNYENKPEIEEISVNLDDVTDNIEELNFVPKTFEDTPIDEAEIIVAAGRGAKEPETVELVKKFADKIGGKFAVSRSLVDLGLFKNDIQVGQTGKTVTPKIYIACGISGAIQHIEGMKNSGTIIAINNDKDAPIFKIADFGIVGDLNKILPKLIERE